MLGEELEGWGGTTWGKWLYDIRKILYTVIVIAIFPGGGRGEGETHSDRERERVLKGRRGGGQAFLLY